VHLYQYYMHFSVDSARCPGGGPFRCICPTAHITGPAPLGPRNGSAPSIDVPRASVGCLLVYWGSMVPVYKIHVPYSGDPARCPGACHMHSDATRRHIRPGPVGPLELLHSFQRCAQSFPGLHISLLGVYGEIIPIISALFSRSGTLPRGAPLHTYGLLCALRGLAPLGPGDGSTLHICVQSFHGLSISALGLMVPVYK
jgi:hypothetical protein